jgi:hypothetical protein
LTRRANQRHDAIIAARAIGGTFAKPVEAGAIQLHAQAKTSEEAKKGQEEDAAIQYVGWVERFAKPITFANCD